MNTKHDSCTTKNSTKNTFQSFVHAIRTHSREIGSRGFKSLVKKQECLNYFIILLTRANLKRILFHCLEHANMVYFDSGHVTVVTEGCRGITRIHRSPSRPRPSVRPTAALINIHEHLI